MITAAQAAKLAEIRNAADFVQDANDPEGMYGHRANPCPIPFMYHTTDGLQNVRIGAGGKLIARKIS